MGISLFSHEQHCSWHWVRQTQTSSYSVKCKCSVKCIRSIWSTWTPVRGTWEPTWAVSRAQELGAVWLWQDGALWTLIYPTEKRLKLWLHKHFSLLHFCLQQVTLPPGRTDCGSPCTSLFVLHGHRGVAGAWEQQGRARVDIACWCWLHVLKKCVCNHNPKARMSKLMWKSVTKSFWKIGSGLFQKCYLLLVGLDVPKKGKGLFHLFL